ncbi:cupin domain-containing protein [Anaeromyxobacter paludicola]|uniref:Zinc-finger domain-containing protein n=1 Tax=Anaeromyxobacter paludicola TaxID=2918171 RepID=A0ABM7XFX3_9BACT|nr:hypothetical protein [Anaeromyxobacter paludicola]BDG10788.1 hypothetical protein AMPC_39010 [Anaeromyxobacter paludicola]
MSAECDRIRADAPGLAALLPDDPELVSATSHARGCPGCERALREAGRLQVLLAELEPEPLPAGALERVSREVRNARRRESWRRLGGSVGAVCISALIFVGFARTRAQSPADWALAAAMWALALVVALAASRKPLLATVIAVAASGTAAALSGGAGPLVPSIGLECVATELASAAVVVLAAWLVARGGATSPARSALVVAAAAGALAGDAALQVTCAAHAYTPHLLAFHVGGVLLAVAVASVVTRAPRTASA